MANVGNGRNNIIKIHGSIAFNLASYTYFLTSCSIRDTGTAAEEITSENSEVDSAWALAAATAPTPRTQPRRTAAIQPRVSSSRSPRAGGYRSAVLTADHWFRPGFAMQFLPSAWRSSLATIGATAAPVRQASATATSPAAAVEPASAKHPCPVAARWH